MASMTITPDSPLIDELVYIQISGLKPIQNITLVARVEDNNMRFISHAHYAADVKGHVTTADMVSVGGSYTGVDQMGLFTTLLQEANQKPGRRLMKRDVTTPLDAHISVHEGHFDGNDLRELGWRRPLASETVHRWYKAERVRRVEVRDGRLMGTFFIPDGEGPFPGVVDMFGTIGGTVEYRSALLASRGIASLALCYFTSAEGITVDLEYFESAIDWLYSQPSVLKTGVGVIGVSKGFEMALFSAVVSPKVKAVVAINGLHFDTLVSHTYKEEVFCAPDFASPVIDDDGVMNFKTTYDHLTADELKDSIIPIERSEAHFLVITGEDDKSGPTDTGEHMVARLSSVGKAAHCECVRYPDAGHLIEPPYSPLCDRSHHAMFGRIILWGGKPRAHAHAQLDSWLRIQEFIRRHLAPSEGDELTTKSNL